MHLYDCALMEHYLRYIDLGDCLKNRWQLLQVLKIFH